jgi:hypothetical protein
VTCALLYTPTDDLSAREHIIDEVNNPDSNRWRAMTTIPYLLQTYRVLVAIERDISNACLNHKTDIAHVRAAFVAGHITDEERRDKVNAYNEWKRTTLSFRARAEQRRRQIVHRVRAIHGDYAFDQAVADHRCTITAEREPCSADRVLWARLTTLDMPVGHPTHGEGAPTATLAEAILKPHTPPSPQPSIETS